MSKKSEMLRQQHIREEKFKGTLELTLRDYHAKGMMRGAYAIAQAVLERANAEGKSADEKLADIIAFCSTAYDPDKKSTEVAKDEV